MSTRNTIPFADLPQTVLILDKYEFFTRVEIGEICGVHPSIITKDCHHLNDLKLDGFNGIIDYDPVPRDSLWYIYAIEMFRRAHMLVGKQDTPRKKFVKDVNKRGQRAIEFWVKAGGGSRDDFDKRVTDFIARKKCRKLDDAAAIDVEAS